MIDEAIVKIIYIRAPERELAHTYTRAHTRTYARTHARTHAHAHADIGASTYTHTIYNLS